MRCTKKNIALFFSGMILVSIVFGGGYFLGIRQNIHDIVLNDEGVVQVDKVIGLYEKTRSDVVDFEQFWRVWKMVKERYVHQPVNDVELFYGSLAGIVSGLNDPHSVYFPPQVAKDFSEGLAGEFGGIGAEIGIRDEQLTVIAPLPETPAERSGLKPGDSIMAINGEETFGLTVEQAVKKIKGEPGTAVVLTITGNGFETLREVSIVREVITIPTVVWEEKDSDVAYIRISYFNDETWKQFSAAVDEVLTKNPQGIILDLRSNPGGYLETSVAVASEWVDDGVIVQEVFQKEEEKKVYLTHGAHRLVGLPTVVLVDGGTASGSEIVAGALQDHNKAIVLGQKTFGKGSVQSFEVFPDGSALKLTIATWLTPSGGVIDKEGVEPDSVIDEMFIEGEEYEGGYKDVGIEQALVILKEMNKDGA